MKQWILLLCITASLFCFAAPALSEDTESVDGLILYVSLSGNDYWSGRYPDPENMGTDGPFRTLERARDAIRRYMRSGLLPSGGVKVLIRGGDYFLDKTFELSAPDSGAPVSQIIYRNYRHEKVRLIGGKNISPDWLQPVTDPEILSRLDEEASNNIMQVNLSEHGITGYEDNPPRSNWTGKKLPTAMELIFRGRPLQPARYPNSGWLKIASVPDGNKGATISYLGDRPKQWKTFDGIQLHGYWTHDWADSYVSITSIDTDKRIITTAEPYGAYGYTPGKRYYFLNILEELDRPGEWYLDRVNGILYFWPPRPLENADILVSTLIDPVVHFNGASDIVLSGVTIENGRTEGIVIDGGARNKIAGCTIRNNGRTGVKINGGDKNGIISSDVFGSGESGIAISGGDRKTLTPAGNYADNNHVHHFSRWLRTYSPGIKVSGVGNRITHNLIHDAPHMALDLNGNNHIIELNEIHDVCWESNDVGALYIGRDWTERGNLLKHNYFHHIRSMFGYGASTGGLGASSIYLDDMASGTTIYGNMFYKAGRSVFIGGGRDNRVENNVFIESDLGVLIDSRGTGWASQSVKPDGVMYKRLMDMYYKAPPYNREYPELLDILEDDPGMPKGNVVTKNIAYKTEFIIYQGVSPDLVSVENNFLDDPEFTDPENGKFFLSYESPALDIGFERLPITSFGLYKDRYRTTLPGKE